MRISDWSSDVCSSDLTDLRAARSEVGNVSTLIVGRDLKSGAGPRRALLEDESDLLTVQPRLLVTAMFCLLERGSQPPQEADLFGREDKQLQKAAAVQILGHAWKSENSRGREGWD